MKDINNFYLKIYLVVLKWRDQILSRPAQLLIKLHVTADMISFLRLILTIPIFLTVARWPVTAIIILLVNFLLDALDGAVARQSKTSSIRGRALDVSIDHYFVIPIVLGLVLGNLVSPFWSSLYMVTLLINYFFKYLRFGIEVGKYPFSLSKYFIYLGLILYAVFSLNIYDLMLIFWSMFLLVENLFFMFNIYYDSSHNN